MNDEQHDAAHTEFQQWFRGACKTDPQLIGKAPVLWKAFLAGIERGSK